MFKIQIVKLIFLKKFSNYFMFDIYWKKLKNKFINESLRFVLNKGDVMAKRRKKKGKKKAKRRRRR